MRLIVVIFVTLWIGSVVYDQYVKYPYRFVGYFYPNIEQLDKWVESEPFKSLDECKEWVSDMTEEYNVAYRGNYDFECGKDCYLGDTYGQGVVYTCKTSVD